MPKSNPVRDALRQQIIKEIESDISRKVNPHQKFIANRICHLHSSAINKDSRHYAFWHFCGYETVMDEVGQVLKTMTALPGEDDYAGGDGKQGRLPGFEHMQWLYRTKRPDVDGKMQPVILNVFNMTDDELRAKSDEYTAYGHGCIAHGQEILRFIDMRASGEFMPKPKDRA